MKHIFLKKAIIILIIGLIIGAGITLGIDDTLLNEKNGMTLDENTTEKGREDFWL